MTRQSSRSEAFGLLRWAQHTSESYKVFLFRTLHKLSAITQQLIFFATLEIITQPFRAIATCEASGCAIIFDGKIIKRHFLSDFGYVIKKTVNIFFKNKSLFSNEIMIFLDFTLQKRLEFP